MKTSALEELSMLKRELANEQDAKRSLGEVDSLGFISLGSCDETCDMLEGSCMHHPSRESLVLKMKSYVLHPGETAWDYWVKLDQLGIRAFSDAELISIALIGQLPENVPEVRTLVQSNIWPKNLSGLKNIDRKLSQTMSFTTQDSKLK